MLESRLSLGLLPIRILAVMAVAALCLLAGLWQEPAEAQGRGQGEMRNVMRQLDLTPEQRRALMGMRQELRGLPPEQMRERMGEALAEILTEEQLTKLRELRGEPGAGARRQGIAADGSSDAPRETFLAEGLSADEAQRLRAAAEYSAQFRGVSMVVLREGERIFEDYPNGGGAKQAHALASGTKSFSCALVAAAAEDDLLHLDEKVSATLEEWRDGSSKEEITLRQLLTLTSGVDAKVGLAPSYENAVAVAVVNEPGTTFQYGAEPFQIFGEVLRRKLVAAGWEPSPVDYLQWRVLDSVGVEPAQWRHGRDGLPHLNAGASFTARDWAAYGELIRRQGRVGQGDGKEKQVLDPRRVAQCFFGTEANPAYGLTWWLGGEVSAEVLESVPQLNGATDLASSNEVGSGVVMAAGAGKQRLYVIQSQGLVVVRQATRGSGGGGFSDGEFLSRLLTPPES
ncbi:MAG: serine hydrolase [Acidobacteriota bacterium]